jgi:hypothetical protein
MSVDVKAPGWLDAVTLSGGSTRVRVDVFVLLRGNAVAL